MKLPEVHPNPKHPGSGWVVVNGHSRYVGPDVVFSRGLRIKGAARIAAGAYAAWRDGSGVCQIGEICGGVELGLTFDLDHIDKNPLNHRGRNLRLACHNDNSRKQGFGRGPHTQPGGSDRPKDAEGGPGGEEESFSHRGVAGGVTYGEGGFSAGSPGSVNEMHGEYLARLYASCKEVFRGFEYGGLNIDWLSIRLIAPLTYTDDLGRTHEPSSVSIKRLIMERDIAKNPKGVFRIESGTVWWEGERIEASGAGSVEPMQGQPTPASLRATQAEAEG